MWYMDVLDNRAVLDIEWITHGPFKSKSQVLKWWDKICDDILSEAEAECHRLGKKMPTITKETEELAETDEDGYEHRETRLAYHISDYLSAVAIIFEDKE